MTTTGTRLSDLTLDELWALTLDQARITHLAGYTHHGEPVIIYPKPGQYMTPRGWEIRNAVLAGAFDIANAMLDQGTHSGEVAVFMSFVRETAGEPGTVVAL